MTSRSCFRVVAVTLLLAALAAPASAQFRGFQAASVEPTPAIELKAGEETTVALRIRVRRGYHINSGTPSEDYMIPTQLSWEAAPLEVQSVEYPAGPDGCVNAVRYWIHRHTFCTMPNRNDVVATCLASFQDDHHVLPLRGQTA